MRCPECGEILEDLNIWVSSDLRDYEYNSTNGWNISKAILKSSNISKYDVTNEEFYTIVRQNLENMSASHFLSDYFKNIIINTYNVTEKATLIDSKLYLHKDREDCSHENY